MEYEKGFRSYLAAARERVDTVEGDVALELLTTDDQTVFLDVRQASEFTQGALPRALHIPRGLLEETIEELLPSKETPVVVYCASGMRSVLAAKTLNELDYTDVRSLNGGFNQWKDEGHPWENPGDEGQDVQLMLFDE